METDYMKYRTRDVSEHILSLFKIATVIAHLANLVHINYMIVDMCPINIYNNQSWILNIAHQCKKKCLNITT